MRPMRLFPLVIAALLLIASCSRAPATTTAETEPNEAGRPMTMPTPAVGAAAIEAAQTDKARRAPSASMPSDIQRLVIKTAQLSIEVENVTEAEARITARAQELGGYVVSVQTRGVDEAGRASTITFRVPAQRFEEALSDVEGLARKVFSRLISGDDVTEEFVDLESRLRNLEATRDRLLELLARAEKVEDALQVNAALTDIQGQIEQIQGRMKYLQQSAAFSTITVDLQPVPPPPPIVSEDGWQPGRVAREALRDLVAFVQGVANLGIVLLIWAPLWLPILLLARWGWKRLRHQPGQTSAQTSKQP